MLIVGVIIVIGIAVLAAASLRHQRHRAALVLACTSTAAVVFLAGAPAGAAIVPTVPLATAANYSVLGGTTVTNTGPTTLALSVGVSPGTAITGFPPGIAGGSTEAGTPAAAQAQSDLTAAYLNAAGRPLNATTTADLANLTLQGGVYAGPAKGALSLTGPLVLDGAGDPRTVFIFQTDSTLTTASGSSVTLINGAQECNVFWQVGSSATLGSGSSFAGNILALTSISVNDAVTVRGRALARNGAVTLINDTFTAPTCATAVTTTTTAATTTTTRPVTTTTTAVAAPVAGPTTTTTTPVAAPAPASPTAAPTSGGTPVADAPASGSGGLATPSAPGPGPGSSSTGITELPRTGLSVGAMLWISLSALLLGAAAIHFGRTPTPAVAATTGGPRPMAGGTTAPLPERQCGRCRNLFDGDASLHADAVPDWWLCPECRTSLLGSHR